MSPHYGDKDTMKQVSGEYTFWVLLWMVLAVIRAYEKKQKS